VQVRPMNPVLKAPEIKRLKLEYDKLLSSFAFNFNLRRFMEDKNRTEFSVIDGVRYFNTGDIGAFTAKVGRCKLTRAMKPTLKAPGTKHLRLKYDTLSILLQCCFQLQLAPLHQGPAAHRGPQEGPGRGVLVDDFKIRVESAYGLSA